MGKLFEAEDRMLVARGLVREKNEMLGKGDKVSVLQNDEILVT